MTLYYAFCSLGPFILLAVTKGAFGPFGDETGSWRFTFLWDALVVLMILAGAVVSLLVLGEVIAATTTTRLFVVAAGCVSVLLLAMHMLWEIGSLYRRRPTPPRERHRRLLRLRGGGGGGSSLGPVAGERAGTPSGPDVSRGR